MRVFLVSFFFGVFGKLNSLRIDGRIFRHTKMFYFVSGYLLPRPGEPTDEPNDDAEDDLDDD